MAAVFYVASRMMSVVAAAAVLVLAAIWGAPNYPTPMPSWYNLYFAVFGAAALFRYLETEKRRWLIAAGCCGGFSCLIKIVGLYYVAAVLIFLVFREQSINGNEDSPRKTAVYSLFIILSTATFLVLLASMMRQRFDDREFTQFFLPPAVIVAGVIGHELRLRSRCGNAARFGTLSRMLVPFTLGVALPIAGFMVPYVRSRSAHAFVQGVFGGLSGRVQAMGLVRPEHAQALVFPLALVCVIAIVAFWERASTESARFDANRSSCSWPWQPSAASFDFLSTPKYISVILRRCLF
jgi:4-amino-4-deoxy-L-arabinose transferase-like glycosyltransferase